MIEHYSHKIQNAIQKELFKANSSIKIAVAWFTNDLLFQPLLLKLGAGVSVELILNKDDINCSDDNEVDFDEFVKAGGILRWNDTKQLLHDKFCIIDNNVVIYGSYNWTNKAEYNEESVAIAKGEKSTTQFYVDKFLNFSKKYEQVEKDVVEPIAILDKNEDCDYYIDEYGVKYSTDLTILYKGVDIREYKILPTTRIIKEEAFCNFSTLEKVDLSNVEIIESRAFCNCVSIKDIIIPPNFHECGSHVFNGCLSLKYIMLPSELQVVGDCMFAYCKSLKKVTLPNNLQRIGNYAFYGCESLCEIDFPDTIESIGYQSFYGCISLTFVKLPLSLNTIGTYAFGDCSMLSTIAIEDWRWMSTKEPSCAQTVAYIFSNINPECKVLLGENIKKIPSKAFSHCKWLKEIVIPDGISSIGESAFSGCSSLKEIKIPETVSCIGYYAFARCSTLKEIIIPETVSTIGDGVFLNCESLNIVKLNIGLKKLEILHLGYARN